MDARNALLEGIFDHAGMFPPTAKTFEDALRDAAGFDSTLHDPDLLGADMVLTEQTWPLLTDEAMEAAGWAEERECIVCLVGVPVERAGEVAPRVTAWNEEAEGARFGRRVVALELVLESNLAGDVTEAAAQVTAARHVLRGDEAALFVEPKWPESAWTEDGLDRLMALLEAFGDDTELPAVGLKVRCDGPTALGPATLARVLPEVAARAVPLKATQGLHHPVVEAKHGNRVGFLGLAVGLRMAQVRGLRGDELAACLGETDASAFTFKGGLSWRDHHVTLGDLGVALEALPFSIGSCSLTEPDDDLRQMERVEKV